MTKKVAVLLSTYNGERYLQEFLDSLQYQTYKNFIIIARDDCSNDNTLNILKSNNIQILESNVNLGAKLSFGVLLRYAINEFDIDYIMFADQDDIWLPNKIEITLSHMIESESKNQNYALAVHTDLCVVDENLNIIDKSFWHYEAINPRLNTLNTMLVQNVITGCTLMINKKLAQLALEIPKECYMHDWWIGLTASAFGIIIPVYEQTILYRQHNNNDTGAKRYSYSPFVLIRKIYNIIKNDVKIIETFEKNFKQAEIFLKLYEETLSKENTSYLNDFISIRSAKTINRKEIIIRNKFLQNGFLRNVNLLVRI